jgi:hypothetical protein
MITTRRTAIAAAMMLWAAGCASTSAAMRRDLHVAEGPPPPGYLRRPPDEQEQQRQQSAVTAPVSSWPAPLSAFQSCSGDRSGEWVDPPPNTPDNAREPLSPRELRHARGTPMPQSSSVAGAFYGEAINPDARPSDNCGGTHLAIMYVPAASYVLARLAVHAAVTRLGVFEDDGGRPGRLLAIGDARPSQDVGWNEAALEHPLPLRAMHRYWIYKSSGGCSASDGAAMPLYYGHFDGAGEAAWEGPHRGHAYVLRMYGTRSAGP